MQTDTRIEYDEFRRTAPDAAAALSAVSKAVGDSGLDKDLVELIKIRASQINGCTFCVQYHLNLARKAGVSETKLDLVAVWRDAGIFTARELAALAWTETLTSITPAGVSDKAYACVTKEFTALELPFLTAAIASINAWNRIAMAFRFAPPIPQETPRR
jgi:AhpD family alkylhydroperoxidase